MFENASEKEKNCQGLDNEVKEEILSVTTSLDVRNKDLYLSTVDSWLKNYQDGIFLGCYSNKLDDVVVALYHYSTIYLIGEAYPTIVYAPKLMFRQIVKNWIHIEDVLMKHNCVGNGSIAMSALLRYARNVGVDTITGSLSDVDDEHRARRNHYYEKFGFEICESRVIKRLEGDECIEKT